MVSRVLLCVMVVVAVCVVVCVGSNGNPLSEDHVDGYEALLRLKESGALKQLFGGVEGHRFPDPTIESSALECAVCSAVVNEVYGLLDEGVIDDDLEQRLRHDCDALSSIYKDVCDDLVDELPTIVHAFESRETVSAVCTHQLHACTDTPAPPRPDPFAVPTVRVDLDREPSQRWAALWADPRWKAQLDAFQAEIGHLIGATALEDVNRIGRLLVALMPYPYSAEIKGAAGAADLDVGFMGFVQLAYVLSDCTSIVVQASNGSIMHARNLDFGIGYGFTDLLRNLTVNVEFTSNGTVAYRGGSYVGFIGLLTAQLPGAFAVTVNTRTFHEYPKWEFLYRALLEWLDHPDATTPSFLVRDVAAQSTSTFTSAVTALKSHRLLSPVYFTVSGVRAGEGVVISREQNGVAGARALNASDGEWYVVQTNYDSNVPPYTNRAPWYDDRRAAAMQALNAMTPTRADFAHLLTNVLSQQPVENRLTTYSVVMENQLALFHLYGRYCNDPCPF